MSRVEQVRDFVVENAGKISASLIMASGSLTLAACSNEAHAEASTTTATTSAPAPNSTETTLSTTGKSKDKDLGSDVSYPQCGGTLPKRQAFGIVGVNQQTAKTPNPCLKSEITWAGKSTGDTNQPTVQFYVNPADPGNSRPDWPTSGTSPYGECKSVNGKGKNDQACAYDYGEGLAKYDVSKVSKLYKTEDATWWIDWEPDYFYINRYPTAMNDAVLEGMTAYFESKGGKVGIYSQPSEFKKISGTVSKAEYPLAYGLPNWVLGATSLNGKFSAEKECEDPREYSFDHGKEVIAQIAPGGDHPDLDLAC